MTTPDPTSDPLGDATSRAPAPEPRQRRLVDLLLGAVRASDRRATEARVDQLLAALEHGEGLPAASQSGSFRLSGRPARTWLIPSVAAIAGLLLVALVWSYLGSGRLRALAALSAMQEVARQPIDRQYRLAYADSRYQAIDGRQDQYEVLYVRGDKVALSRASDAKDAWLGFNGQVGWLRTDSSSKESADDPRALRSLSPGQPVALPDLRIPGVLARILRDYDLEYLPGAALPGNQFPPCIRVRAKRTPAADQDGPVMIDLWAEPNDYHILRAEYELSADANGHVRWAVIQQMGMRPQPDSRYDPRQTVGQAEQTMPAIGTGADTPAS